MKPFLTQRHLGTRGFDHSVVLLVRLELRKDGSAHDSREVLWCDSFEQFLYVVDVASYVNVEEVEKG